MKKKDIKAIDEILQEFDFEKVHKVMKFLKWQWAFTNGIPNIEDMKKLAKDLLTRVCEEKTSCTGTGGFTARRYEKGILSLEFNVTTWDTFE